MDLIGWIVSAELYRLNRIGIGFLGFAQRYMAAEAAGEGEKLDDGESALNAE